MGPNDPIDSAAIEALAAEYVADLAENGTADRAAFLARLDGAAARALFEELVSGVAGVRRRMPRALSEGALLGGRYRLEKEIGSGGMGRVFRAVDGQLDRRVALKLMNPISMGDVEHEALFRKESQLLASLQHPGIVAVHELGRDGDVSFIAMDLVDGPSLADVLTSARTALERDGGEAHPVRGDLLAQCIDRPAVSGRTDLIDPASWYRSVTAVAIELVRTLEAAHGRGVVHRDLKPSNIVLTSGGHPVVLDFGLAGRSNGEAGEVTRGLYGSVAYIAPEQARSHRVGADPRTDVYQLGLVLYEMLVLRRAFDGEALGPVLAAVKEGRIRRPRSINPLVPIELEAVCLRALELDPKSRYQDMASFRADLERSQAGLPPTALQGHRLRSALRTLRFVARERATGLAMVLGVALAALGLWQWLRPGETSFENFVKVAPGGDPVTVTNLDTVRPEETLGVVLDAGESSIVYTLSVHGGAEREKRYVKPVRAMRLGARGAPPKGTTGLPVPSGRHLLMCTRVEADRTGADRTEGLWVFAATEPAPWMEEWIAGLESENALDPTTDGVPYAQAIALLEALKSSSRGGDLWDIPDDEREQMFSRLTEAWLAGDADWQVPDMERAGIELAVVPE